MFDFFLSDHFFIIFKLFLNSFYWGIFLNNLSHVNKCTKYAYHGVSQGFISVNEQHLRPFNVRFYVHINYKWDKTRQK